MRENINYLYGYRTKKSMANIESWRLANSYWPRVLLKFSVLSIVVGFALFIVFGFVVSILGTFFLWIIFLILSIFMTENKLGKFRKNKKEN
ncbi:SdpI family protein [Galbibacter pacificus]|uniref:SdpI family protein n=2 Tax=Galbibacter pacificus TaxID=2996052 RepID=UPI003BB139B6